MKSFGRAQRRQTVTTQAPRYVYDQVKAILVKWQGQKCFRKDWGLIQTSINKYSSPSLIFVGLIFSDPTNCRVKIYCFKTALNEYVDYFSVWSLSKQHSINNHLHSIYMIVTYGLLWGYILRNAFLVLFGESECTYINQMVMILLSNTILSNYCCICGIIISWTSLI